MDHLLSDSPTSDAASGEIAQSILARQEEAARILSEKRERFRQLETTLSQQLAEQLAEIQHRRELLDRREAETQQQRRSASRELRARRAEVLAEIAQQQSHWQRIQLEGDGELRQQMLLAAAERDRLREELNRRDKQTTELAEERNSIRRQLETQQAELQIHRTAADKSMAEAQLRLVDQERIRAEAESQAVAAKVALEQARDDQDQLRQRLSEVRKRLETREQELTQIRALVSENSARGTTPAALVAELAQVRAEREELKARLDEVQTKNGLPGGDGKPDQALADSRRRLELALQEIRELKTRHASLEAELARTKNGAAAATQANASASPLSWEDRKKQVLAALEAETDLGDDQRSELKNALRLTEEAVAQKDRELEELRRLLDDQSQSIQGVAVGANAIAAALDSDELVRVERENLRRQQEELQGKLRAAEIKISLERAQMARERAELEEKRLGLEKEAAASREAGAIPSGTAKSTGRGRWLARLGLRDKGSS